MQIIRPLSIFLAFLMIIPAMAGCAPTTQTPPTTTESAPTTTTESVQTPQIDEEQVEPIKNILAAEIMRAFPLDQSNSLPDEILYETDTYQILRKNSQCYLNLFAGNTPSGEPMSSGCIVYSPYLRFDNLDQLYQTLTADGLSDSQISGITRCFPLNSEIGFILPDPQRLVAVTLPEILEISSVKVYGEDLDYYYREMDKNYPRLAGNISILDRQKFQENMKWYNRFRADPGQYQTAFVIPELNAIAYDCNVPAGVFRFVQYSVQTESKTLFIEERYAIERSNTGAIASDTVPLDITVFGYENGYYFSISLSGTQMRPSIEFLDSFHFKAYTPQ